jgi:hypothetical protein
MGLNDHRKSYEFHVLAAAQACTAAFREGMSGSKAWSPTGSKWEFKQRGATTVAVYQGRSELMQFTGMLAGGRSGQVSRNEAANAVGSEVKFEIVGTDADGRTVCRMHLAQRGVSGMVFTSDARFIRPAMQRVEKALSVLDAQMITVSAQ